MSENSEQSFENIEYPVQTSIWGESLIDTLNSIFHSFKNRNNSNLNYIKEQFEALKSDVFVTVEKAESTANEALLLAKENKKKHAIIN